MVSYGLAYGMEAYGLGQRLNIPTEDAAVILDAYFVAFPNVKAYMDGTVLEARERGYTETLFGRRRPIPELMNSNFRVRQAGERQAMNAGIQGLAADIFKVAVVRIDEALVAGGYESRLILQVHDEVHRRGARRRADRVGRSSSTSCTTPPTSTCRSRSMSPGATPGPTRRPERPWRNPTTGSSRWPTTWAPRTTGTRTPRARCRRSITSCRRSGWRRGACARRRVRHRPASHELARRGFVVHGVDISERFVELARSSAPDGATFERLDARTMPFDAEFDAVDLPLPGRVRDDDGRR